MFENFILLIKVINVIRFLKKFKLGIKQLDEYIFNNANNFSPENKLRIERVVSIKDLESEIFNNFKKELHACFGIP